MLGDPGHWPGLLGPGSCTRSPRPGRGHWGSTLQGLQGAMPPQGQTAQHLRGTTTSATSFFIKVYSNILYFAINSFLLNLWG